MVNLIVFVLVIYIIDADCIKNENKLFCQNKSMYSFKIRGSQRNTFGLLSVQPTIKCCGRKPFDSNRFICCLGKILSKLTMKCCLDGSFLPKQSVCRCHPQSDWIKKQITEMDRLQKEHIHLIEQLSTLVKHTEIKKKNIELQIKKMDKNAENMYNLFLNKMQLEKEDSNEADHIIKMIKFQYTDESEKNKEADLFDVEYFDRKKRNVFDEEQTFLNGPKNIEAVVLKRESLLEQLSQKYQKLNQLESMLQNENIISGITKNDMQLMSDFISIFDELMTEVLEMEKSLIEEHPDIYEPEKSFNDSLEERKLSIRRALSEDPLGFQTSFRSSEIPLDEVKHTRKSSTKKNKFCDFTPWLSYINSYKARVTTVKSDIKSLRSALTRKDSLTGIKAVKTAKQLENASAKKYLVKPYYRRI